MVNRAADRWFYLSGLTSLLFCALLFFALIAFMHFRAPVITAVSTEEITVSLEMPIALEPEVTAEEATPVMQSGSPLSVRDMFGEINATASMQDLLAQKSRPKTQNVLAPRIELPGDAGQPSRLPKAPLELQAHAKVETGSVQGTQSATAVVSQASVQDKYLSMIHKRLAAAWHPGHADLGKMARIEMRIFARGSVAYEIKTVQGDQPFVDRLTAALEKIRAEGVEPPPQALKLDVRFVVKE